MQLQVLNNRHNKFLQQEFNMSLGEFKNLPFSVMDKMVDDSLMWIECDEDSPDSAIASEIIDSIYGPYSAERDEKEDDDSDG
jgi:hypothetical protein